MDKLNNDDTPIDVIEYSRIFNIAADILINLPYLLIRKSDDGWGEDITPIVILGIRTTEIEYTYWGKFAETTGVRTVITPDDFVENGYKLVRLTGDMIKGVKE